LQALVGFLWFGHVGMMTAGGFSFKRAGGRGSPTLNCGRSAGPHQLAWGPASSSMWRVQSPPAHGRPEWCVRIPAATAGNFPADR
jgi:hypothetical protein